MNVVATLERGVNRDTTIDQAASVDLGAVDRGVDQGAAMDLGEKRGAAMDRGATIDPRAAEDQEARCNLELDQGAAVD